VGAGQDIKRRSLAKSTKRLAKLPKPNHGSTTRLTVAISRQVALRRWTLIGGSLAAMLPRMIDRASDFCKDAPNTDYRVKEELSIWDDLFVGDSDAHGT
jgi:hypothetical protein